MLDFSVSLCIVCGTMTEKQKIVERVKLLHAADRLMREALQVGGHHPCFGEAVCDAQLHLDDAIVWADKKQTLLPKR